MAASSTAPRIPREPGQGLRDAQTRYSTRGAWQPQASWEGGGRCGEKGLSALTQLMFAKHWWK